MAITVWHVPIKRGAPDGGANRSINRLAKAQAKLGAKPVLIYAGDEPSIELRDDGVTIAHVPFRGRSGFTRRGLTWLAGQVLPDLMHLNLAFVRHNTFAAMWARSSDVPYVIHPRGALNPGLLSTRKRSRKTAYMVSLERRMMTRAALHVGNTSGDVDDYLTVFRKSKVPSVVIPNGVVDDDDLSAIEQVGHPRQPSGQPDLGYLGRWDVRTKGLDRMVDVARTGQIRLHCHSAFRLAHKGQDTTGLLDRLPEHVVRHPMVDGEAKWAAMSRWNGYLQLSRWESFGNAIAEAMAVGLPVFVAPEMHIARELPGLMVTVDADHPDRVAGQILDVMRDPVEWERLSSEGAKRAREEFHVDRTAQRVLDAYKRV